MTVEREESPAIANGVVAINVGPETIEGDGKGPAPEPAPAVYYASIHPGPSKPVPPELAQAVKELETHLEMPVWLLRHSGDVDFDGMDMSFDALSEKLAQACIDHCDELPSSSPVAILIDSPGGLATATYRLARLLQRRCGSYVALVPRYAKSAATLLCLGAERIVMGDFAELGPLDVQLFDPEREERTSALDEVNALGQLTHSSLESVDEIMILLIGRTRKRVDSVLPHAMRYVADTYRPMFEKIDAVHYTMTARLLKVAEYYAIRLLAPHRPHSEIHKIASSLIENYPSHEFLIDREEAELLNLQVEAPAPEIADAFSRLRRILRDSPTFIGPLVEVKP